mmetsp:Transcript_20921/g.53180  ORF Transcript_20921/g.53180 Transcript_20921/m.53180 type:complete len:241 (-) Transcript_20921:827-1549(-)
MFSADLAAVLLCARRSHSARTAALVNPCKQQCTTQCLPGDGHSQSMLHCMRPVYTLCSSHEGPSLVAWALHTLQRWLATPRCTLPLRHALCIAQPHLSQQRLSMSAGKASGPRRAAAGVAHTTPHSHPEREATVKPVCVLKRQQPVPTVQQPGVAVWSQPGATEADCCGVMTPPQHRGTAPACRAPPAPSLPSPPHSTVQPGCALTQWPPAACAMAAGRQGGARLRSGYQPAAHHPPQSP